MLLGKEGSLRGKLPSNQKTWVKVTDCDKRPSLLQALQLTKVNIL